MVRPSTGPKIRRNISLPLSLDPQVKHVARQWGDDFSAFVSWATKVVGDYCIENEGNVNRLDIERALIEVEEKEDRLVARELESRERVRRLRKLKLSESDAKERTKLDKLRVKYPTPESVARAFPLARYPESQVRNLAERYGHDADLVVALARGKLPPARDGQTTLAVTKPQERAV